MSNAVILEPKDMDRLIAELKETVREEIAKLRVERMDRRMNFKQAAAFLSMHRVTLAAKFKSGDYPTSLIHVIGKSKYLLESELEAFKKSS